MGEGVQQGEGVQGGGGGGRGYFIHLAMYCTAIWCFALKGLRTIMCVPGVFQIGGVKRSM